MTTMYQVKQRLDDFEPMTVGELRGLFSVLQPYIGTGFPGVAATRLRIAIEIERLEWLAGESQISVSRRVPLPRSG